MMGVSTSTPHLVLLFILFSILTTLSLSSHTFDVYNIIRMEKGKPGAQPIKIGSQRALLNSIGITKSATSLSRKTVIITFDQLNKETFDDIISRGADGILVLLPNNLDKLYTIGDEAYIKWNLFEKELLQKEIEIPVYFTTKDEVLSEIYEYILDHGESRSGDYYQMAVTTDTSPINDVTTTNIQGQISGSNTGAKSPIIAIVAHYDTFGLVPGMATGADSNGSGVAALLELARIFAKLYSGAKTQGKHTLQFVLTSGGTLNYAGTKKWLDEHASLENVEFALCLDTIGADGLHLYVSRPPKDPAVQKIYESFTNVSTQTGIKFGISHKKINVSDPNMSWEHEQFSLKRVIAGTLSRQVEPSIPFAHSGLLDKTVNITSLTRNIQFIGEVLAKLIYGLDNVDLLEGEFAISEERVRAWADAISRVPRVTPYITSSPTISQLDALLSQYLTVSKQIQPLESDITFFGPVVTQMTIYRVKPAIFDLYLSILIAIYLVGLVAFLKGKEFVPTVRALFKPTPQKPTQKKKI